MQHQANASLDSTRLGRKRPLSDTAPLCSTSDAHASWGSSVGKKRTAWSGPQESIASEKFQQGLQSGKEGHSGAQASNSSVEVTVHTAASLVAIPQEHVQCKPNAPSDAVTLRGNAFRSEGGGVNSRRTYSIPAISSLLQDVHQLNHDGQELLRQLHQRVRSASAELHRLLSDIDNRYHTSESSTQNHEKEIPKQCDDHWPQQLVLENEIASCRQMLDDMEHLISQLPGDLDQQSLLREDNISSTEEADILVPQRSVIDSLANVALQPAFTLVKEVRRLMASVVERINCVESGSSLWCTHAGEVQEYLQHLQESFTELESKRKETERKLDDLRTSITGKRKHVDQVKCRLEKMQQHYHLASIDIDNDTLFKTSNKMDILERRREALERELKSLAAFSPLFIVERTAKYITLQYRPEGSTVDHEISIEGLDVSLSKGASKLSPFFSVHIHPPNKVVNALLENQIKQLMNNLIVSQKKTANAKGDVCGVAPGNEHGEAGADDAVVKHIASILIKTLSSAFSAAKSPPPYFPYKFADIVS